MTDKPLATDEEVAQARRQLIDEPGYPTVTGETLTRILNRLDHAERSKPRFAVGDKVLMCDEECTVWAVRRVGVTNMYGKTFWVDESELEATHDTPELEPYHPEKEYYNCKIIDCVPTPLPRAAQEIVVMPHLYFKQQAQDGEGKK